MKQSQIDKKISKIFDEQVDIFPETISQDDEQIKRISSLVKNMKGKAILDVGCGKGRFVNFFSNRAKEIVGIEPAKKLLEEGKKKYPKLKLLPGSATEIPFPDNTFDVVLCVEVLEHVPEIDEALKEMKRVLKKAGELIIIDKNLSGLSQDLPMPSFLYKWLMEITNRWMYSKDFPFREQWFRPGYLKKLLQANGFKHVEISYLNTKKRAWQFIPSLSYFAVWYGKK